MIKHIESECKCAICGNYSARMYCEACSLKVHKDGCGGKYARLKRKMVREKRKFKDIMDIA